MSNELLPAESRAPSMADVVVDWDAMDPAAATSMRMALALGVGAASIMEALGGEEAVLKRDTAAAQATSAAADAMALTAAVCDPENEEAAWAELQAMADDEEEADAEAAAALQRRQHHAEAGHEAEEGGMEGYRSGVAETSWGGEGSDWSLERIARRRKAAAPARGSVDYTAEELQFEYQCHWLGYSEPTWERGHFLRDMGFGREVEAFDASRAPKKPTSTRKLLPWRKPNRAQLHVLIRLRPCLKSASTAFNHFVTDLTKMIDRQHNTEVEFLWRGLAQRIVHSDDRELRTAVQAVMQHVFATAFGAQLQLTEVTVIQPQSIAPLAAVAKSNTSDSGLPSLLAVFHGTVAAAVRPISRSGLVIPGQGNSIGVRNGQLLGLGIYSSIELARPACYAHQGDFFLCAAWSPSPTPREMITESGVVRVFFDQTWVSPILHFKAFNFVAQSQEPLIKFADGVLTAFTAPKISDAMIVDE